jgi:hypothetical protein
MIGPCFSLDSWSFSHVIHFLVKPWSPKSSLHGPGDSAALTSRAVARPDFRGSERWYHDGCGCRMRGITATLWGKYGKIWENMGTCRWMMFNDVQWCSMIWIWLVMLAHNAWSIYDRFMLIVLMEICRHRPKFSRRIWQGLVVFGLERGEAQAIPIWRVHTDIEYNIYMDEFRYIDIVKHIHINQIAVCINEIFTHLHLLIVYLDTGINHRSWDIWDGMNHGGCLSEKSDGHPKHRVWKIAYPLVN